MAIRVFPRESPRLIVVLSPDVEITQQDLTNEVMDWEDEPFAMTYPHIISPSGKQILPDGITRVAITNTLLNAQIAFEPRTTSKCSGTVTTGNSSGSTLIDSGATFVSSGVLPGATIINLSDMSVGTVLSVDSEIQLSLLWPLSDGSDNQFDIGDVYKIWNTVKCEISGGNLVSLDDVGAQLDAVFPTSFTQIVMTASSSATLQELSNIQHSSFNGGVTIDVVNGYAGTAYPIGTQQKPSNNLADSKSIATSRGFESLFVLGNITFEASDNVDGFSIIGQNPQKTTITLSPGLSTEGCEFEQCTLQGTLDGDTWVKDSVIGDLTYIQGQIKDSTLTGIIILAGTDTVRFINCSDGVPGINTLPIINMGGSGRNLIITDYDGSIVIGNLTGEQIVEISIGRGHIHILDTVTAGTFVLRGIATLEDESTGTTFNNSLLSADNVGDAILDTQIGSRDAGTLGEAILEIRGLSGGFKYVDNTVYDDNSQLLSCRIRIFDTKEHCDAATPGGSETDGMINSYSVVSVWGSEINEFTSYKQVKD